MKINSKVKAVIIFTGGVLTGGLFGVIATRNYFKNKYEEEADERIESMEKYVDKIRKIHKNTAYGKALGYTVDKEPEIEKAEPTEDKKEDVNYHELSEQFIKEKVKNKAMAEKVLKKLAEQESPEELEELEEIYQESEQLRQKELNEAMNNREGYPYVISESENATDTVTPRVVLDYYMTTDTIVDEDGELVQNYHDLLGDLLQETGYDVNDEDEIYIKNPGYGIIYEVNKLYGGYDE